MMKTILRPLIALFAISTCFLGCTSVWHNPNTSIPSKKIKIINLIVTPTIYDNAGVEVEGKVWDLRFESDEDPDNPELYSLFKLADKDGNYINVKSSSELPAVAEGEEIKVIGIHRLIHQPETGKLINELEAYSIEK